MNLAVVDESSKRRAQLAESLKSMHHNVTEVSTTQALMELVEENPPEQILLDVDTWKKNRAICQYFQVGRKLEKMPILFYNSYEGFSLEGMREPHEKDRVLTEPTKVEEILSALEQTL